MAWVIDLDGVVWLAGQPIPGAAEAVSRLRKAGEQVLFLTNNSSLTIEEYHRRLGRAGITVEAGEVLTSAQAAASLLAPGSTALACGGPGVWEALEAQGVAAVARGPADAVVVGWDRSFDFDRLAAATTCVLGGARLVGTNGDPTYPTPDGPLPGAGALLAAVACATATTPVVAGKPYEPVAALLRERLGEVRVVVGDRPSTDGALATRLGARFALVLSGVTPPGHGPLDPVPDLEAPDLARVVDRLAIGEG